MIPIAGSAYTYTYATMGELIAWIIGWDLILEYAVSNMAVSVGFAAHMVATFDWFGWHPSLRWITPAYLPGGLTDLAGQRAVRAGLALRLQPSRVSHRDAVDRGAGARHARVGGDQQHHGAAEDRGHPGIRLRGHALHSSVELSSLRSEWLVGRAYRRLHHFLHLHRIRFGLDRRRGSAQSATRSSHRHHRDADRLHDPLHRSRRRADRNRSLAAPDRRRRAGRQQHEPR